MDISGGSCSPQDYSGTLCLSELEQFNFLDNRSTPGIAIPSDIDQEMQETMAQTILTGLQFLNPSKNCEDLFRPFFCLYIFGGICNASRQVVMPSFQDCVLMKSVCAEELQKAISLLRTDPFPECSSFPSGTQLSGMFSSLL